MADPRVAVVDTSIIISLAGIGRLGLLDQLFDVVIVPSEVWGELTASFDAGEPEQLLDLETVEFRDASTWHGMVDSALDAGERETIAVALQETGCIVLLDDLTARKEAARRGIEVKGTLGLIAEAKRRGLVPSARPLLTALIANGFRLAPKIANAILASLGEPPL